MAGAYGTAGETCRRGTNIWPDTGGGWINGRSDDTTTMLNGYAHMVEFFTSFEWWKVEPHDELVTGGAYCLAKPGEIYAIYVPDARKVTATLAPGRYDAKWFSAVTGRRRADCRRWTAGNGRCRQPPGAAGLGAAAPDTQVGWSVAGLQPRAYQRAFAATAGFNVHACSFASSTMCGRVKAVGKDHPAPEVR